MYIGEAFRKQCMEPKIQRCIYIMLHMLWQIQECTKEIYTYATKELPHINSRNKTNAKLPPQTSESWLI
jgi:hypothetical protein